MKNKNIMFAAVLLFAVALPLVPTVYASGPFATNYTNASLSGVYGYSSDGWHLGPSNSSNNSTNVPLDATGTLQYFSNGSNHTRAFAIVDGGRELQLAGADGLDTSRGVAKKQ